MSDPTRELLPVPETVDGRTTSEALLYEIRRVIVGQDAMLERVLVAVLAGGPLPLAGVTGPPTPPTTAAQAPMPDPLLGAGRAGGPLLLEGVPGLAKTLTIKTLADVLDSSFRRIPCPPDPAPAAPVGTRIYRPARHSFDTELGPVFANFVLADEINRAPAKVPSARAQGAPERPG